MKSLYDIYQCLRINKVQHDTLSRLWMKGTLFQCRFFSSPSLLQNRLQAFNEIVTILVVIEYIALARFREQCYDASHREDQFRIGVT